MGLTYRDRVRKLFKLGKENILYPGKFRIDFIVVGAQKAGTSVLDQYLRDHDGIEMPKWKELHYFDNDGAFEKERLSNIRGFYKIKNRLKIYGECTPNYMYWEPSIERIKNHNPAIKIIAVLRNPVERAFSHWTMEKKRDWENREFKECIEEEIFEIKHGIKEQHRVRSYVQRGMYAEQIKKIYSLFPKDQVLFLKYEVLLSNQLIVLNKIFSFIGVDQWDHLPEKKEVNVNVYQSRMKEEEKDMLLELFLPSILELEELLKWDCSDWKQ